MLNFPQPQNLGHARYYKRFIPSFSKLSKPLKKLLQKDVTFHFDSDCQKLFNDLKQTLTTSSVLIYQNFDELFILTTDASAFAIRPIGKDIPITYTPQSKTNF